LASIALTHLSGASRPARPFPGKCCFPGIYFVSNIPFFGQRWLPGEAPVETIRLTRAVKNAWANQRFAGFASNFMHPLG
jgi:hypothetical protein